MNALLASATEMLSKRKQTYTGRRKYLEVNSGIFSSTVSGLTWAKVRSMFDHSGQPITEAKLSEAVQIIGWKDLPTAGDVILEVENEKKARTVMRYRVAEQAKLLSQEHQIAADKKHEEYLKVKISVEYGLTGASLPHYQFHFMRHFTRFQEYKEHLQKRRAQGRYFKLPAPIPKTETNDGIPKVNVIVKGDVAGSVEAILDVFNTYGSDDKCQLNIVHYGVGPVTETDLQMADAFDGKTIRRDTE